MPHFKAGPRQVFSEPTEAELNQANPTPGTKYTVLAATKNVRIIGIWVKVTWTVQPNPLEVWVLIDGIQWKWSFSNPVTATNYYCPISLTAAPDAQVITASSLVAYRSHMLDGKSVLVQAEITGGTSNPLQCKVKYQVKRP